MYLQSYLLTSRNAVERKWEALDKYGFISTICDVEVVCIIEQRLGLRDHKVKVLFWLPAYFALSCFSFVQHPI